MYLQHAAHLRRWSFDPFEFSEADLETLLLEMFVELDVADLFEIDKDSVRRYLSEVRAMYRSANPYHNFRHAFDVTQALFVLLTTCGGAAFLRKEEVLALFLAAVAHDMGHPGQSNMYHVQIASPFALQHNDRSVLESFHVSELFKMMAKKPSMNPLAKLPKPLYMTVRKLMVEVVLATDLSQHVDIVGQFSSIVDAFDRNKADHRLLLAKVLMKCADISNQLRPPDLACRWSELVQREFFLQGDLERSHDLAVSPFMNRLEPNTALMVTNFIRYIVQPIYATLRRLLPSLQAGVS